MLKESSLLWQKDQNCFKKFDSKQSFYKVDQSVSPNKFQ